MEFFETVNKRRTIRDFCNEDIPREIIEKIIDAGMKAPSNDHMRDWHFILINDKTISNACLSSIPKKISNEEIDQILHDWNLLDQCQQNAYKDAIPKQYRMLLDASYLIIPLFKEKVDLMHPENISHLNGFASIWCCLENILLATTALGYAATLRIPLGNEAKEVQKVLNFPDDYIMPCFLAIGKQAPDARLVEQKECSLKEHLHDNIW